LSTNHEDVHICGGCKQNFSDINFFVEHKHSGCIRNTQKFPSAASTLVGQSTIDYLSTTSSPSGEDSASHSPLGAPIFRVIVDGSNLSLQPGAGNSRHTLSYRGSGDSQILRSRLLGIQNDQQVALQEQNITSIAGGMQAVVMQQQSRREFQVDEETVATILANQLANEDDTSTHANMPYSRTGLMIILFLIMYDIHLILAAITNISRCVFLFFLYIIIMLCSYLTTIQVSQEECARLREGDPYGKVYRYNPKHLCPKLNGYGNNASDGNPEPGQRSLKL
jgi:hypothetical protein